MNYRIDLVVLSHSFYQTEFFTHIQKPKEASHSRLAALGQFLRDPAGVDEELYVFLAKKIVRTALAGYKKEKRFFILLTKCNGGSEATLYLEDGERLIEYAEGNNHGVALKTLRHKVAEKVKHMRAVANEVTQ